MPPSWPLLSAGVASLGDALIAEADAGPVGFAAVDLAGSVPLILVDPSWQRRGIGTGLLAAALEQVRAAGAATVTAGSGGAASIWPGVPQDLPAAVAFFASRGWRQTHDTLDLTADLTRYRPPADAHGRAASPGITIARAAGADMTSVLALETAAFPNWVRWFSRPEDILIARDRRETSLEPCCSMVPTPIPWSRPCSAPPPGPSDAWASRRPGKDAGSAPPSSCAPPSCSGTPAPASATSAGRPASRSTAGPAISPGGAMPCSRVLTHRRRLADRRVLRRDIGVPV
jgi:Acetyltransferase (GNAT) domain